MVSMNQILINYQQVRQRITDAVNKADLEVVEPCLLAVSKKHSLDKIITLAKNGHKDFGESYAQEGVNKIEQCQYLSLIWHFIGPIQSNKAKLIAEYFAWVHSVDRMKIVKRLMKFRSADLAPLNVLLQLKVGDEASKSGASLTELLEMAAAVEVAETLSLRGIMCIPPSSQDFAEQKFYFMQAKEAFDVLKNQYKQIDTLSMGMSNDLEAAVECGSTMVRVGTDIFGKRPY